MLYQAYQAQSDVLAPIRLFAQAAGGVLNQPQISFNPFSRPIAAACEVLSRAAVTHDRPPFGIDSVRVNGKDVRVTEEVVFADPFCHLVRFRKDVDVAQPRVLVVAPMSGHFATLLRGTVQTLATDHDVYITDWQNARNIPLANGRFDFDDFVDMVMTCLQQIGPGGHVLAVCQPSVPVIVAVALMAACSDPAAPRSMTLMGGPIDTRINPTVVNKMAASRPFEWYERNVIDIVPARYPGRFRRVYPGFVQLASFMLMNLDRHINAHVDLFKNLVKGDGQSAASMRKFYDEYLAVMDLPAEFYLQTVKKVFQEHELPRRVLTSRDREVELQAITKIGLLTVEGEKDDICSVGQTGAAQELCSSLPASKRAHHVQPGVGHYGVFNGKRWQNEIYPIVKQFILEND